VITADGDRTIIGNANAKYYWRLEQPVQLQEF